MDTLFYESFVYDPTLYIRTTQIYAKIVDENKRKAVNLVPKI